jgi:predicted regulator of Ras-like GTPase activity (Roadblock/LC7/MglB family)
MERNESVVSDFSMQDILSEMAAKLAGVHMITVIDTDSMVLAAWQSPDNSLSPDGLGTFLQRINSTLNAFKQSPDGFARLGNVILNTPSGYIIMKPIYDGACFIAVDAPSTVPMSQIRAVFANYAPSLEQTMPGYQALSSEDSMRAAVPQA